MSYTLDLEVVGSNGTAKLLASVLNEQGEQVASAVEVTPETLKAGAGRLAQMMPGAHVADVEQKLRAELDVLGLPVLTPTTLRDLVRNNPYLRRPLVHGVLRQGETMNLIAASKTGKSWLAMDLALSIATGTPWLGFETTRGDVLYIDNELHEQTIAHRFPAVAAKRDLRWDAVADHVSVQSLRGKLRDIHNLRPYFNAIEPGRFPLVIFDTLYRLLPRRTDENDNGEMAQIYNLIDSFAERLGCSFCCIHHASKGDQSGKAVTDVGAGAGSQSRAVDTHFIIRPHEEDNAVVMDAAVRSWKPIEPRCLRWDFPVWNTADDLDPTKLRKPAGRKAKAQAEPTAYELAKPTGPTTPEEFVAAYIGTDPRSKTGILSNGNLDGLSDRKAGGFLAVAESRGLAHRWRVQGDNRAHYATIPQPTEVAL